jgi:hypothetical protein
MSERIPNPKGTNHPELGAFLRELDAACRVPCGAQDQLALNGIVRDVTGVMRIGIGDLIARRCA